MIATSANVTFWESSIISSCSIFSVGLSSFSSSLVSIGGFTGIKGSGSSIGSTISVSIGFVPSFGLERTVTLHVAVLLLPPVTVIVTVPCLIAFILSLFYLIKRPINKKIISFIVIKSSNEPKNSDWPTAAKNPNDTPKAPATNLAIIIPVAVVISLASKAAGWVINRYTPVPTKNGGKVANVDFIDFFLIIFAFVLLKSFK